MTVLVHTFGGYAMRDGVWIKEAQSFVKIEENEEMTVLVHTFGGYAMRDGVWIKEAQSFAKTLKKNGDSIDFKNFYTACYDSPMKFWNRRNEVMFLVNSNEV